MPAGSVFANGRLDRSARYPYGASTWIAPGLPLPGQTSNTSAAVPADSCVRSVLWYGVTSAYVTLILTLGCDFLYPAKTASNGVRSDVSAKIFRLLPAVAAE